MFVEVFEDGDEQVAGGDRTMAEMFSDDQHILDDDPSRVRAGYTGGTRIP
ncbi:MAG: hypothetical protein ACLP0J_22310 [Solirubrobacteraceae bacterium]